MTGPVTYCYGQHAADAKPKLCQASGFDQFVEQILALPRARSKTDRSYICGPMRLNGDGGLHRCKADLLPRSWLALDLDGGSREEGAILLMRLADYQAVAWSTWRYTPECPRIRIVLFLDREVDGPEAVRLGAAFVGVVGAGLHSLKWDQSTHRGEQECYLPMAGAEVMRYAGDPVDVNAVLALAPAEPARERPETPDPYQALIMERGLFLREIAAGKNAIICPFASQHSEETSDTATVYLHPHHNGHRWGRIYCLHHHCADRQQEDYIRALGAEPRGVWRGQAGGPAPYDALPPVESYCGEVSQWGAQRHTESARAAPTGGEGRDPGRPYEPPSYPQIPPLAELRIAPAELHIARLTPQCVVESYLYADVAVLAGPGGTGKTTLALWEAVHIALGRPLYGLTVHTPGNVVLV